MKFIISVIDSSSFSLLYELKQIRSVAQAKIVSEN